MDIKLARPLTEFFAANRASYPYFLGEAQICRHNYENTTFEATTKTPGQTAEVLRLFGANTGLFAPNKGIGTSSLSVSFDMIHKPAETFARGKVVRGVHMVFSPDTDDHRNRGVIWHHSLGGGHYGPGLARVIDAFAAAGRQWSNVDFTRHIDRVSRLRLVVG